MWTGVKLFDYFLRDKTSRTVFDIQSARFEYKLAKTLTFIESIKRFVYLKEWALDG